MASAGARLEPEDSLSIRYTFDPEMNQAEIVRPVGQNSAMLMGKIPVVGMTAADLSKFLVEQTSHHLCESKVMDDLLRSGEKTIYVGGEVGRSGAVPCRSALSPLMQAVLVAGGFRETARFDSIILARAATGNHFVTCKIHLEHVVFIGFAYIPCIPTILVFERNHLA
jgi:protein involved in polysaccharide export with SLBB domain